MAAQPKKPRVITRALTRDDFAKVVFYEDFFEENPALAALAKQVRTCRAAYYESAKKSACGCGGNPRLIFDCLDAVLARLEQLRTADPAALQAFVSYAAVKTHNQPGTVFVLYYRKTAETPLLKVSFP